MKRIVLINPNTSRVTTAMMTDIARKYLNERFSIEGVTVSRGVPMILDDIQLAAAADGVVELGQEVAGRADGLIVSAFGDPGLERLRQSINIPVVGICEAGMLEASAGSRRFGIATVTPDLVTSFAARADGLGVGHLFTGTRLTEGDPMKLASEPERLLAALEIAVHESFERDGSEAVIIGGGPLGEAAAQLQHHFSAPVIAPIRSAVELLLSKIAHAPQPGAKAG